VADDAVRITRRHGDILIGACNEILKHTMEIRGLGVIDVQAIFGIRSIRAQKRVEVEVHLTEWKDSMEYERLGLDERMTQYLGVEIPLVTIPIFPGKNITVIAEVVALNHLVKVYGYHPAKALSERLNAGDVVVVDDLKLNSPKTKEMIGVIAALALKGKTLIVAAADKNLTLASRNVPDLAVTTSDALNTYDVLRPDKLLFTRSAFEKLEARLGKE